jgi:hypothetical protein
MDKPNALEKAADKSLSIGSIAAKLFGVVNPVAATVSIAAECIQQRRSQKFVGRLEKLVCSLDHRVQRIEDQMQVEPDVDLFDEIIAKAISDEDEDKIEYYASLIEYYTFQSISPQEVRLLSNAFKSLMVSEINGFTGFATGQNITRSVSQDLIPIFWSRVHFLGLYKGGSGGVKHVSQVSQLGKHFVEVCKLALNDNES